MRQRLALLLTLLLAEAGALSGARAQSIWSASHLAEVKAHLDQPAYRLAYEQLMDEAQALLSTSPVSVMMKDRMPPSGTMHDYMSLSRYYWPDPTKPDGLPYVNRDGESNPELEQLDRNRLSEMATRVATLSLAFYLSDDEQYATKAVEQLRTWFLDAATHMNPNLDYAQVVPGRYDGRGRCYGVIDSYSFVEMLDAVQLLEHSQAFTRRDRQSLRRWFARFLDWILTSEQGQEESRQTNNHSTAYDVQVIAYALYTGRQDVAQDYLRQFPERRIKAQIQADGQQPNELWRTLAYGYSQYNLSHMIDVMQASTATVPLAAHLPSLEAAADYLAQYLGKPVEAWPHQQISQWQEKQQELCKDLYRLWLLDPSRTDYLRLCRRHMVMQWRDRFFLLYFRPTATDHAFARAEVQLRYKLQQTERQRRAETGRQRLMPRSVERDGRLRLVDANDWCSGFFPGELWLMFQYTHQQWWREQAVSNTWLIEQTKWHRDSHDVGFMMGSSFGKGYELTGEQSFRDVLVQSARTLSQRFSPQVGCLRSWSWGGDRWQFPVIIDNMMNLELLFEASRITGDPHFRDLATSHADQTLKNHFREDFSTYHVVDYDPTDGHVIKRITFQGLFDESVWSRGQAWALYGFTMCYRYTRKPEYLLQAQRIAQFFFSQKNLPSDLIPYWDMRDPAIPGGPGPALDGGVPRDASAAAVMASGLYELASYSESDLARRYRQLADGILHSLTTNYQSQPHTSQGFLLQHSTGNYPAHDEIDVPINYADFYYLEALNRQLTDTLTAQP